MRRIEPLGDRVGRIVLVSFYPYSPQPVALTAGARLESYQILALLGSGGMGEVTRTTNDTLGNAFPVWTPVAFCFARSPAFTRSIRNRNKMIVVDISTNPNLTLSQPRMLFEQRYAFGSAQTVPNYDVSPDGQRFVMVKDDSSSGRLNIVLNWQSGLTARERR
jgi:hypothetical protein